MGNINAEHCTHNFLTHCQFQL